MANGPTGGPVTVNRLNNCKKKKYMICLISFLSTHKPTAVHTLNPVWETLVFNALYDVDIKKIEYI